VAASFVTTALNAVTPQIFRFSLDEVLGGSGYGWLAENLWLLALSIVAVAVLSGGATFVTRTCTARAGENFAKNMRDALFVHVQRLPMSWHDKNQTGDIIQRCTSDVEVIRNFVVTQLLEVFRTVFLVGISFGIMVSMNRKLALVVLLFVPVVVLYSAVFYRLIARRFTRQRESCPQWCRRTPPACGWCGPSAGNSLRWIGSRRKTKFSPACGFGSGPCPACTGAWGT
jgi:ATP-binding cassette subfamily B protein